MEKILKDLLCFIQQRFKIRLVVEDMNIISDNQELELRDYFAYELRNNGNITAIINDVIAVRPNSTFSNANWEGYQFSEPIRIKFDAGNTLGFNTTGSSQRLEYIIKKLL